MLLGHDDKYLPDIGMQVTITFNHFSVVLVQRMPRCRRGYIHVVNNDFTRWEMYAIGGRGNPTINRQGNRYTAPQDQNAKEVTKRVDTNEGDWSDWNWRTERNGTVRSSATTSRSSLVSSSPQSCTRLGFFFVDTDKTFNDRAYKIIHYPSS
ncbi:hypothetical protein C1H46_020596 [Malus baccata]|uniref:Pectate lyase n=1 Tax=Malus baccata TaxID=106549 RepID=A0A540M4Z8_MALBA|nr:hypothetical protein C1H46_020596 [Malus baccata]